MLLYRRQVLNQELIALILAAKNLSKKIQSHKENHYSLKKHPDGYFYILKNETLANNKIEVLKARCKQDILRLKNGLKSGSHGQ